MPESLDSLAARITALEDRQQIADLIAGYGPAVDACNGDAAAATWAEGGRYEIGANWCLDGRGEIAALTGFDAHQAYVSRGCGHVLSPHKITVDGRRARAFGYSMVVLHKGDGWRIGRLSANRWVFEKGAAGWTATSRRADLLDGARAARALLDWAQPKEMTDD
ncbi:nuclear transport factor 2 family protein [Marinovum sp.]|uniref:nuclear transport factor 2 family protein n=1 Tax=Marinovum sp. TaxID=2024839 RepID=UPI002B26E151|nr:nuclear transport factor 2 family protein [Marinovum sp.]